MNAMIGLASDHALVDDPECLALIDGYATDQSLFYRDFAASFVKLTELGAVWRDDLPPPVGA